MRMVWIDRSIARAIVGSVDLALSPPLDRPVAVVNNPSRRSQGRGCCDLEPSLEGGEESQYVPSIY